MGRTSVITEIVIERVFGKSNFLSLFAGYVSDRILADMNREINCENDDFEGNKEKTADLH